MTFQNPSNEKIYGYLANAKNIAIVGLSNKPDRISYQIAEILQDKGYKIIPVNPMLVREKILGEMVYDSLSKVPVKIDIVNIFRRSEFLAELAREFIQTDAKVFWAQLGIENQEAAEFLEQAGKTDIVMNRCIKVELRNSGL